MGTLARLAAALSLSGVALLGQTPNYADDRRFYEALVQQNKAQAVMLTETGLISRELGAELARGLRQVEKQSASGGFSANYLDFEKELIAVVGPQASIIHMGRSRNDLGVTSERLVLRAETLRVLAAMHDARAKLLDLAERNVRTIIPGYTHSVQAQPTTLAHYLAAFASALERDEERILEAYHRLDRSPLGSAAFTTSGFSLDRKRLQDLMGFGGMVENSYDAIIISSVDTKAEVCNALALSAITIGRFAQQFLIQYTDPRPGLNLSDESVGHSSIMPQKRNPSMVEKLRMLASSVVGDAQTVMLTAHNTPAGEVGDIRMHLVYRALGVAWQAGQMYESFSSTLGAIQVNPELTLALVNSDFSVMTEFADTLLRESNVPFRIGHQVASELAAYGRANGTTPVKLTYAEVRDVYRRVTGEDLKLNEQQVRNAFDPVHFVASRKGIGGPQFDEMSRMLKLHRARLAESVITLQRERARIDAARQRLEAAFDAL